jgi:hypothetical protein
MPTELVAPHPAADVGAPPTVESSTPSQGQTAVYPSPYGDGSSYRVALEVRFSSEMDTYTTELPFGPVGQAPVKLPVVWAENARSLKLFVYPPPLAPQILQAETSYQLGLAELRSATGQVLQWDANQRDATLRFTTGQYDALLNHSCGHTVFGPFGVGVASMATPPVSIASDTHVQYDLSFLTGKAGKYQGHIGLRLAVAGQYRLYFDQLPEVNVVRAEREERVDVLSAADSCPGIRGQLDLKLDAEEAIELALTPSASLLRMIIESVVQ